MKHSVLAIFPDQAFILVIYTELDEKALYVVN